MNIMEDSSKRVSTAEVAFIAGLEHKAIHRLVEDEVLPSTLFHTDHERRFERIAAPLARFYVNTSADLTSTARKRVITEVMDRLRRLDEEHRRAAFSLSWRRTLNTLKSVLRQPIRGEHFSIEMAPFVIASLDRAKLADQANKAIVEDPEILGGAPVFNHTRLPITTVVESLDKGVSLDRLRASWPFLTEELVEYAKAYLALHPRRGRPTVDRTQGSAWKVLSHKTVKRPGRAA